MTYHSEHQRLRPVLEQARALNIGRNPAPLALFDPLPAGFNIWCTPEDHPQGWQGIEMDQGAFSKPCAFVAAVHWRWSEDSDAPQITGLNLATTAYALRDRWRRQPDRAYPEPNFTNRPEDLAWARDKIRWLFHAAGVPLPPIHTTTE
jgi:hypothetical protein